MIPLIWTAETPTTPGWYWCGPVKKNVMSVVQVRQVDGARTLYAVAGDWRQPISKIEALWAGPIPEPEYPI